MIINRCFVFIALASASAEAFAAGSSTNNNPLIDRILRHDTPDMPALRAAALAQPNFEFDFGLAYTNNQGPGSSWEVPLGIGYLISQSDSIFLSSGILRTSSAPSSSSGADDFTFKYQHVQPLGDRLTASFAAAVILPSGGNVGSNTAVQLAQGGLSYKLDDTWSVGGSIAAVHIDKPPASVSTTGEVFAINLKRSFGQSVAIFKVKQKDRDGTTGTTTGEFEFDFSPWGALSGSLVADHGFTNNARDNSLEFDLAYQW